MRQLWPNEPAVNEELDFLGRVVVYSLEYTITYKCVNHCAACNHFTHIQPKHFISIEQFKEDLYGVAKVAHCDKFSLIGGEALLHPNLNILLDIINESDIGDMTNITSNGQLVNVIDENFLDKIDRIEFGIYSGKWTLESLRYMLEKLEKHGIESCYYGLIGVFDSEIVKMCEEKAKNHKDWVTTYSQNFHYTLNHTRADEKEAQRRFNRCLYGHVCNTLDQGYIYRCPESGLIPPLLLNMPRSTDALLIKDLTVENFREFVLREIHTETCHHCCATENYFPWHEVPLNTSREEWLRTATEPIIVKS